MKVINPFNRKEKRDFIPLSLFPASKMTRTSMQIGRFVPVYCAEMRKNNRIQLSHDQLTRFASMRAPVMQNFEMGFGAYFVPYVAFDKFFDSSWFRENIINANYGSYTKYMLRARDFFNPATADSLRRHPAHIFRKSYGSQFVGVGSLFDHLQMPLYFEELEDRFNVIEFGDQIAFDASFDSILGLLPVPSSPDSIESTDGIYYGNNNYSVISFGQFVYYRMYQSVGLTPLFNLNGSYFNAFEALQSSDELNRMDDVPTIVNYIIGISSTAASRRLYEEFFEGVKPVDLVEDYRSAVMNSIAGQQFSSRKDSNLIAWLAYLSIYGHYCLNELFVSHEDWNDLIGCAYLVLAAEGAKDSPTAGAGVTLVDAFTGGSLSQNKNEKIVSNPWLEFYAKYLRRCECLPVLWNKDQFTGAQYQETTSATPIGSTITENFFNRMYARFKDLIARMGGDYKKNVDALLGGSIPDSSLNYPQVVKRDSFTVQIGDIAQTSASSVDSFLGEFAGYAVSRDHSGSYDWTAEEDGVFMVCCWCRPKNVAVATAVPRLNLKSDFFDYLIPQFGGVGYQDIPYKQIYPSDPNPDQKFAIQERYFDYMTIVNECSGLMRTRLKHYHLDRILDYAPDPLGNINNGGLDFLYVTEKDNCNRIFNDQLSDPVIMAALFQGSVTRQLPAKIQTEF